MSIEQSPGANGFEARQTWSGDIMIVNTEISLDAWLQSNYYVDLTEVL